MIVLDTNVLSALMQRVPDERVVRWLDRQPAADVWTTTVTLFEAHYGIQLLPPGRRRDLLFATLEAAVAEEFEGRVLAFDAPAAVAAAQLAAARRAAGRTVDVRDTLIAGIARARRAAIATRNARHFEGFGVEIVDPWAEDADGAAAG